MHHETRSCQALLSESYTEREAMQAQLVTWLQSFAVCDNLATVAHVPSATERFRLRIYAVMQERGVTQRQLKGPNSEGWISNKLRGLRDIKLDEAEQIAKQLDTPLTELLRRPEDRTFELDSWEGRLIEAFRQLTPHEQEAFVTVMTLRQRPAPYVSGKVFARQQAKHLSQGIQDAENRAAALAAAADDPVGQVLVSAVKEIHAILRRQVAGLSPEGAVVPPRGRKIR